MAWWSELLELLYPSSCVGCGRGGEGSLCHECREALAVLPGGYCSRCGCPSDSVREGCGFCREYDYRFERVRSASAYRGTAKKAVLRLKSRGDRHLASSLAALMVNAAGNDTHFICADAIGFVPSGKRKLKERGFNPAELVAREVSRRLGIGLFTGLFKCRETRDQSELSLEVRLSNPVDAFGVVGGARVYPNILLVDDVLTTGATVNECARVLKESGADSVSVLVATRTLLSRGAVRDSH